MEIDVANFVKSIYSGEVVVNSRVVIAPHELDIFLPEINVAFEFNGTYWHSDAVIQDRLGISAAEYHQMKTDKCALLGIELFHIAEYDWVNHCQSVLQKIQNVVL